MLSINEANARILPYLGKVWELCCVAMIDSFHTHTHTYTTIVRTQQQHQNQQHTLHFFLTSTTPRTQLYREKVYVYYRWRPNVHLPCVVSRRQLNDSCERDSHGNSYGRHPHHRPHIQPLTPILSTPPGPIAGRLTSRRGRGG